MMLSRDSQPEQELQTGLANLYQTKQYSDLSLFGRDGIEQLVHKAIVCPRSRFFEAAVQTRGWESDIIHRVDLPEEDEIVRLVVEYLYSFDYQATTTTPASARFPSKYRASRTSSVRLDAIDYGQLYGMSATCAFGGPDSYPQSGVMRASGHLSRPNTAMAAQALPLITINCHTISQAGNWTRSSSDRNATFGVPQPSPHATVEPHLLMHTKVYAAATKYGIDGLKALAMKKLNTQLTRHFDSAELADMIHFVRSEDLAGDEGLLEALANVLSWHPMLLDKNDIEVAVKRCPGLAFEILKHSRRHGDTIELSKGSLIDGAVELLSTGELHDFTIICGTRTYLVHAFVLVTQSTFFRKAILGGFEEATAKMIRLIPMDDDHPYPEYDDPEALKLLVHFLYRQEYEFRCVLNGDGKEPFEKKAYISTLRAQSLDMLGHAKMFAIAVKYDVSSLRRYAFDHFKRAIATGGSNPGLGDVIREVYTSTPEIAQELRGALTSRLLRRRELLSTPSVRAAIESVDGLAYDLLVHGKNK
ncbi:unnamed protein product [Zymoseptoria tritici ST99CH_3D7]|uniref:BTB domain-containing protein n=1 Tax=Zymoseptoria tritici (strain ST99CH_3D7) TaxID=1276538 RepID=A0A1X7RPA4_ZYMT9|nr:unnamed protein product [Zymoseptoria tritici ST99CH_3D7]